MMDRMNAKLSGWKRLLLNKAGRTTLARFVIATIPSYYMQSTRVPELTCNLIDRTVRNFIWKDSHGRGINLVSRSRVAQPRDCGALGIRRSRHLNIDFLGELVADLVIEKSSPWAIIMKNKYGCKGRAFPPRSGPSSPIYHAIYKASQFLLEGFELRI